MYRVSVYRPGVQPTGSAPFDGRIPLWDCTSFDRSSGKTSMRMNRCPKQKYRARDVESAVQLRWVETDAQLERAGHFLG